MHSPKLIDSPEAKHDLEVRTVRSLIRRAGLADPFATVMITVCDSCNYWPISGDDRRAPARCPSCNKGRIAKQVRLEGVRTSVKESHG